MYLAQTSLIPVAVALARFLQSHGLPAYATTYPYWYLGLPFRYLMGPVVPILLVGISTITPLSFFAISWLLIIISYWLGSLGWGILAGSLSQNRRLGIATAVILLFLPWKYVSGLMLAETSTELAKLFVPWILLCLSRRRRFLAGLLALLMLLVNTSGLTLLLLGVGLLSLVQSYRQKPNEDEEQLVGLRRRLFVNLTPILVSLGLATLWYGPHYWWRLMANPWIGGATGVGTLTRIWEFIRTWLPWVMAAGLVRVFAPKRQVWEMFAWLWLAVFGLLTAFRFLANVNFWQDWLTWLAEVEIGLGFIAGISLSFGRFRWLSVAGISLLALSSVFTVFSLNRPADVLSPGLEKLSQLAGDKLVFISGATVWWANALYDLRQVRGGADRVAPNQVWNQAAWEIREGSDVLKSLQLLKSLNVKYVLVHGHGSTEYYRDFRHLEKWNQIGQPAWSEKGDTIYRVP